MLVACPPLEGAGGGLVNLAIKFISYDLKVFCPPPSLRDTSPAVLDFAPKEDIEGRLRYAFVI